MPIQTTYSAVFAPGFPGMQANQEPATISSKLVEDASLAFGVPVFKGTRDQGVTATVGGAFEGISMADKTVRPSSLFIDRYSQFDAVATMKKGVIFVITTSSCVAGEPVFVTAGGQFSDVASGDTALPGVTFETSGSAGALVKLRLA